MKIVVIPPKDKLDYLAETIVEGLYKNRMDIYSSDLGNGIRKDDVYSDEEIVEHSKDCDFIFVIWGKIKGGFPGPKYHLLAQIKQKDKVVFIDGSEWTSTGHPIPNQVRDAKQNPLLRRGEPWIDEFMFENSNWYFKRECYKKDLEYKVKSKNIKIYNLAANYDNKEDFERLIKKIYNINKICIYNNLCFDSYRILYFSIFIFFIIIFFALKFFNFI